MSTIKELSPFQCKDFLLSIGEFCIKENFLILVALARKTKEGFNNNTKEILYNGKKGLFEIDQKSANLIFNQVDFDDIENMPFEISKINQQEDPGVISFKRGDLVIYFEIINFNNENPCALFYAEKI